MMMFKTTFSSFHWMPVVFSSLMSVLLFHPSCSVLVRTPPWPHPYWDIPGDYCRGNYPARQCCPGRQDSCNMPILGTLCYCDTFCNRTENADCCPDYFTHCEGLGAGDYNGGRYTPLEGPGTQVVPPPRDCLHGVRNISNPVCQYKRQIYQERATFKDNCNICRCQVSGMQDGCMEVMCSREQCLIQPDVLIELEAGKREGLYSWVGANYSAYWGRTLEEGVKKRLGAFRPDFPVSGQASFMTPIQFSYEASSLPSNFSAEDRWGDLLSPVVDQGWCSSSWAISTAATASDRVSIDLEHRIDLSPQVLLNCDVKGQGGCRGGHVDQAWHYLRRHGLREASCVAYTSGSGELGNCSASPCHAYHTQPSYRVGREPTAYQPRRKEEDIMHEIKTQGPVQALMQIYTDFFMYKRGIYHKTNLARGQVAGYHALRVVGWGEEGGQPYWRLANSWGSDWGEAGHVRIRRGQGECQIEDFVVGVWPKRDRRSPRLRHNQRDTNRLFGERTDGKRPGTRHGRRPHVAEGEERKLSGKLKHYQVG